MLRRECRAYSRHIERNLNARIDRQLSETAKKKARRDNASSAIIKARKLKTVRYRNNVLAMASPNRKMAATVEQWDNNDWLLNTPEATIDMQDMKPYEHASNNYITMLTRVSPENVKAPIWKRFLDTTTDGDVELQRYMQRVFGYCLTGLTTEQSIFFGYGTGGNGKSIMLNTISEILGDYHKTATMDTFIASNSNRHPTELAYLRGARFITAVETEQGRRWNESRIKVLTGGEKITARFMRENFFEFTPHFKIFVVGNHKPSFSSVDEAIRRRFQLIPFTVTIPKDKRDKHLFDKLKPEWPAILHWMLAGAEAWRIEGLNPPASVREATEEYLTNEDPVTMWARECTRIDANAWTKSSDLYENWKDWTRNNEQFSGTQKWFTQQLTARQELLKLTFARRSEGRGYIGIQLKGLQND